MVWSMEELFATLHVVSAVFIVGPMAILPMTAMRAIRAGQAGQVQVLARSTQVFALLSLLVVVFGFGILGFTTHDVTITTSWVLWSLILFAIALGVTLFLVVPAMQKAADELLAAGPSGPSGVAATPTAGGAGTRAPARSGYPAVAMGSGIAALLLVVVVVLMTWKP